MANEVRDAKDGLKARLETISGLRVYDHVPDGGPSEYPAAIIQFVRRTVSGAEGVALGGSSFVGSLSVILFLAKSDDLEAYDEIDKYIAPLGTNSIEAAIDGDNTWGSNVDDGRLESVENITHQEWPWGGRHVAAQFNVQFIKQVTT